MDYYEILKSAIGFGGYVLTPVETEPTTEAGSE